MEKALPYVQHNAWLALLVETGIVGMGLFVLLLALWIRNGWRVRSTMNKAPASIRQMGLLMLVLFGAYFPNAMFQDTNIIDGVNLLMFCMAAESSPAWRPTWPCNPDVAATATSRCTQSTSTPVAQHG